MSEIYFPTKNNIHKPPFAAKRFLRKENIKESVADKKQNTIILTVLCAAFLFGVVFGAVFFRQGGDSSAFIKSFVVQYLQMRKTQSYYSVASGCFFSALITYIILLLFAYSGLGTPFIAAAVFSKGIAVGAISAYLYLSLSNGIVINLIEFLPWNILSTVLLLIFAVGCCKSSIFLFKHGILNIHTLNKYNALSMLYRFVITALVTIPLSFAANILNLL